MFRNRDCNKFWFIVVTSSLQFLRTNYMSGYATFYIMSLRDSVIDLFWLTFSGRVCFHL